MPLSFQEDRPPVPPADLIDRVALPFEPQKSENARRSFDTGGRHELTLFDQALAGIGREFNEFERLLDFGCGCGRFVRHLGALAAELEVHGVDIDADMIGWLQANVPFGQFVVGPDEPPLPYDDGYFDLVINHSVFTHLDERMQDLWLAELQRVTRPGGILMLTVQSLNTWNRTLADFSSAGQDAERYRRTLETEGILFISDDGFVGSTHPPFYHSTVHAPWYLFEHWTRFFEIAAYQPNGAITQDLLVLRRRPDDAPVPTAIGHRGMEEKPEPAPQGAAAAASGALERAVALIGSRDVPQGVLGKAKQRLLRGEIARRERVDRELLAAIREVSDSLAELRALSEERGRSLHMVQVGLYEQGRRMSVLSRELRREFRELVDAREGELHGR